MLLACTVLSSVVLAGIPHIKNSVPAQPPRTAQLEELWRFGGEDCDILLGTITEAATDSHGNVYLLDTQLCHVIMISPDGEYLRTLSREGEGPGEVSRPRDVVVLPDQTVGLLEMFPAKLVKVTDDGEPAGNLIVGGEEATEGGFTAASRCLYRGGSFVVAGQRLSSVEGGQKRVMYLCRLADSGAELVRYREATMTLDFQNLCFVEREMTPGFHLANAVGPDGRVYTALAWDRYAIEVFQADGRLDRVIEREFENRERTAEELRRVNALFDASARNNPYNETRKVEPNPAVISNLHVDNEGNLWVLHSRSNENLPAGIMQTYDLFDPEGRYLQQVSIACEGDPEFDGLEFLDDGRILLIKGYVLAGMARSDLGSIPLGEEEESSPMEIICCRYE
jgi:hypothetical protein